MLGTLLLMATAELPLFEPRSPGFDWLIDRKGKTEVYRTQHKDEIVLSNGLIARTFRVAPNGATVGLSNLMTGEQLVRAVKPEAVLTIEQTSGTPTAADAAKHPSPPASEVEIAIGGLMGQPNLAFLTQEWLDAMKSSPASMQMTGYEIGPTSERFPWKRIRRATATAWPPPGKRLTLWFEGANLKVGVYYEMYDGIPLFSKWISVQNVGRDTVRLKSLTSEVLGLVEAESIVDSTPEWRHPNLTALSDYAFGGMATKNANRTVYWETDPDYKTQVNYELNTPCVLAMRPPVGPDQDIAPGATFQSFRSFILVHDQTDRERQGLALRQMYRTIAPWVTENPIMLHLTSTDPRVVKTAIDQASECGFEMIVISFWSGLDMEDESPANIEKFKELNSYAKAKGIELGGYSLLASRSIDAANNVVNPKPAFGSSPCLESPWGHEYFRKVEAFLEKTGFDLLEHDGSYPGDTCSSTVHPGHRGLEDSQWNQFQRIANFYQSCRAKGIFLNVPDNYFLMGSNKTAMGYRESNWSLPRAQQHIHARQNLYDGTWEKTPSMGWMMTPLVEYQGGGKDATIEPLSEHLTDYRLHLLNNFGYGAQSCYRGPRIYDTSGTKEMVQTWVRWFKKYRDILESDIIHVRRADANRLDAIVHVNPHLPIKAMALVYNPLPKPQTETFEFPLYYAGLQDKCSVEFGDSEGVSKKSKNMPMKGTVLETSLTVPAMGCAWIVCR